MSENFARALWIVLKTMGASLAAAGSTVLWGPGAGALVLGLLFFAEGWRISREDWL